MLICQEIVEAFDRSLEPQRAKQATERIESLRKNENYIASILEILVNSEAYPGTNLLLFVTELKTITHIKRLTQNQISSFYNSFIKIIHKRADKNNHKMLRQVAHNLTSKDYQNWFNFQQFQQFLKNDVGGSNFYKRWMLSIAIGIPEACQFQPFSKCSQKCIQKYDNLIHQIWPRICQFEMIQIHYILKFLYKCIKCSSVNYSIQLMKKFLSMVLEIGQFFFKKDFFVTDQPSYPSKAAKYLLRLLKSCLIKQREHAEEDKANSLLQMWSQSNGAVVALFNTLFNRISKEHPFIGQVCEKQILLESIKLIDEYFSAIMPEHIDEKIEKLLYTDIPRMLYNLRSIVECQGMNLQSIQDSLNNPSFRLKKSLLRLWRSLSCIDLDFKSGKLNKNSNSIGDISNSAHNQKSMSDQLHIKFVFQKLSETETFFSPFQKRRKLSNQKIWNFQSNQEWVIVAFDLFRVLANDISNGRKCLQNMRVSISDILLMYVLPKIVHKNALIQSHAIAVLVTYKYQFESLKISKEILTNISHIISSNTSKAEEIAAKNTLFCCLPSLKNNWQVRDLIREKIEQIIDYFIQRLKNQQEHNYEVAWAFSNIISYYGQSLKAPQKQLDDMVESIIKVHKKGDTPQISIYMQCVEKFISSIQNTDQIGSSILKLFNFSLSLPSDTDQLLEEDILCCIKAYIKKVRVLSQVHICMFVIYCVRMCHHSDEVLTKVKQMKGYERIKSYCNYKRRETCLDQSILYVVQYFSVHKKFYQVSRFIGYQPYQFYFDALEAYAKFYRQKPDQEQKRIYIFNQIIKGLITMAEYMLENCSNSQLIIGKIWLFSNLQIFQPYQKQLLNFFDAPQQIDPNLMICYSQLVKNLAQLWALSTAYFPEAIQQIIISDYNFLLHLILLVKSCKDKYLQENFRCTIFSAFRQLLCMAKVKKNELEEIINLIVAMVPREKNNTVCNSKYLSRLYLEEDDSFQEEDFEEDNIYNKIRKDWGPHQQLDCIEQFIKIIQFLKKDQISKYQVHLEALQIYQDKLMAQYQYWSDAFE